MLFLRPLSSLPALCGALLACLGLASAAGAASITAPLTSTQGAPISGSITIDDGAKAGKLVITARLDSAQGDVRAILAQVADESLLEGLSIEGARRRNVRFEANDVGKVRYSKGLGLTGNACPCDFGIRFPARRGNEVSITLAHATQALTIALFFGQDFAVAASNIRTEAGGNGNGVRHALLEGRILSPVPEPGTALMMALGLAGLSARRPGASRRAD